MSELLQQVVISDSKQESSKFVITAKGTMGRCYDTGGDRVIVESKEAELRCSTSDKINVKYEVLYFTADAEQGRHFSLGITRHGYPIAEALFPVVNLAYC